MEETTELLACPKCGSELFVSARIGGRIVFHIDDKRHPIIVRPEPSLVSAAQINKQVFYCGACSWKGSAVELVVSQM